jgi:outer membrane protein assembly factor BamB
MKRNAHFISITARPFICLLLFSFCATLSGGTGSLPVNTASKAVPREQVNSFLEESNIKGGFVVHAGCGDGALTAALGNNKQYVIQGLEKDEKQIEKARHTVLATGNYGRVSVKHWQGNKLPYAENLVNLLIIDDRDTKVPASEITRVLAPRGMAIIHKRSRICGLDTQPFSPGYSVYTKPVPQEIDDWPHYLYGADNNAVSHDRAVGPPERMQWVCGPAYARSHEINSSMAAMVSAGGRIFYIWDDGPLGQPEKRFPSQWSLIARDGFNGILLWKKPMPGWGWRQWHAESRWDNPRERATMLRQLPRTTTRRLAASDEKLYVTVGYQAPVSVLDAATGGLLYSLEGTEGTDEILLDSKELFLCVRDTDRTGIDPDRDFRLSQNMGTVVAVNPQDGRVLWQSEPDTMSPLTLAVCKNYVYYAKAGQVVCLDRATGRKLWQSEPVRGRGRNETLVAQDEVVLYAYGPVAQEKEKRDYQTIRYHQAHAFSAQTGKKLWSSPPYRGPSGNARDIFVIDGLAWFGVDNKANLPDHWRDTRTQRLGYDLLTGSVKRRVSVPKLTSPGHHYRCYRSKATERFLLLPKRGVEFLDLQGDAHMRHDWLRAPCTYGVMPANGMLYIAPHQCVCYQGVLMSNFNALTAAAESDSQSSEKTENESRLIRGPKYGRFSEPASRTTNSDWPMYRRDPRRSGCAETAVSHNPQQRWEVTLNGPITPPVVAGGILLVAEKDAHTVHGLDAETGRKLWHYAAGARIDSPPTVCGPLVLFGSADGWVYCLDVSDGTEVWRFLAAPQERQVGAFGQMESAWPVHGSVMVQNDVTENPPRPLVYFTAGRSTYLDGGIRVYALDPLTGRVRYETSLEGPRPDPFEDTGGAGYMDGAKSDILVSDGADLFLHQERFRSDLKRFEAPMQQFERERGGYRDYPSYPGRGSTAMRLISSRGFLDDSYNEGTYWALSKRWPGWDRQMGRVGVYGQLMVFNERTVFGVHVFYNRIRVRRGFFPGTKGYRLFAKDYDINQDEAEFKKTKDKWSVYVPIRVRAMVLAADRLFIAGPPDVIGEDDPLAAFEGRKGADVWAVSALTGAKLSEIEHLESPPVYDGLIAAGGRLYISTADGCVHCYGR